MAKWKHLATVQVAECQVVMGFDQQGPVCTTIFPDGEELVARPDQVGPFRDPWMQCWTHQVLHSYLAQVNNKTYSPALYYAATGVWEPGINEEENLVIAWQTDLADQWGERLKC